MRLAAGWGAFRQAGGVGRLAIQFGAAFAIAMSAMGLVVLVVAERSISARIDSALAYHSAKFIGEAAGGTDPEQRLAAHIGEWQRRKVISERTYILYDRSGRRIAGRLALPRPAPGFSEVLFKGGGKSWQKGRALARVLPGGGTFVVVQHSEAAASLRALLPAIVAAIFASAVTSGLLATFLFARLTAQRLVETQAAADAIAAGDLTRRIATGRLDGVFAAQAASLNRMLDRMEEMVRLQRHFTGALAHDLRTPLTRLRGMLSAELAQDGADRTRLIERAERECAAVIATFDALLRLAEIESGRHPTAMAPLCLADLVEEMAETMEPVIADHGGTLLTGWIEPAPIRGDVGLLNQLLVNLLENIATHTPAGTRATLSLTREQGSAVICLADNGPGLPADERERVLLAFERGRAAAPYRGSGLGLAIAQAIVRFHGGRLTLADNAPGLQVRIVLPLAPEAPAAGAEPSVPAGERPCQHSKFAMSVPEPSLAQQL